MPSSPPSPTALDAIEVAPAFTADAAYVINEDVHDPSAATWQIVKVVRPSAPR
jgi:hypothetical protein